MITICYFITVLYWFSTEGSAAPLPKHSVVKRRMDMSGMANKDWKVDWTTVNPSKVVDQYDLDDFQVINKQDLLNAEQHSLKNMLNYVGLTLAAVFGFFFVGLCLILNPKQCMIAFGSGSPCCLIISPCILSLVEKFLDPGKIIQNQMTKYIPGIILDEKGKITETYEPSPEEMEALQDVVEEVMDAC